MRRKGPKISLSFKENVRDIKIYDYLINNIKDELGISTYIKDLIDKDMKEKNKERN